MNDIRKIAVIGGGASGLIAAGYAAFNGADVTLFERNSVMGKKVRITGKGRCNVTNNCDLNEFLANVIRNPKFLYAALSNFLPADTMEFFENLGVPLKTERGRRVFPVSDKAADIARALEKYARDNGVKIINQRVKSLCVSENADLSVTGVKTEQGEYNFDAVIIATGGISYTGTGSDGDGYKLAKSVGIEVTPLKPSLVPIETEEDVSELAGVAPRNVVLSLVKKNSGKVVFSEMGEMLFTHFGISGPLTLSASAHISDMNPADFIAKIDMKPALDEAELDRRLLSDFAKYQNRDYINALGDLLPAKMIPCVAAKSGIDPHMKVNSITKEQRRSLLNTLKGLSFRLKRFRPIEEAIITAGGVAVREINPSTMASKKIGGLYFAGEVIDVDAYTGGYNLQIAFSTGMLAGQNAAWGVS